MIAIVIVSHSARLAQAALELAQQMVPDGGPRVLMAAGAGVDADGTAILGTDAALVAAAVDAAAAEGASGVFVLMDLGSAVLSAELALELRASTVPVRLAAAPFIEGLLAAVVAANAGATLDAVAAEASEALTAKAAQLGEPSGLPVPTEIGPAEGTAHTRRVLVRNPLGIHARPAALIAGLAGGATAALRLKRLPDGPLAEAASLSRLLMLGARQGDELELSASGEDAEAALDALVALIDEGFGEMDAAPAEEADATAAPSTETNPASGQSVTPADGLLRGIGVSAGRAAGIVAVLAASFTEPPVVEPLPVAERAAEAARIDAAASAVAEALRARAAATSGEARSILEATALIAGDPALSADAAALVASEGTDAARAVWLTAHEQIAALTALGGRMAERSADLRDVRDRIIAELLGRTVPGIPDLDEPFVLIARDLAPADTVTLGAVRCVALVTEAGGPSSHTAILARALGIPAVVSTPGALGLAAGSRVLVDGDAGTVDPAPSSEALAALAPQERADFDGSGRLADGSALPLLANVGNGADARAAAEARAEGIGLFRTEFCFLERTEAPTIAEQVAAYRGVLAPFADRKVIVRTLDAGADKPLPFANDDHEENPALGVRGLRLARRNPALLREQLAALAEAAVAERAKVEVMAPMVATVDEARDFARQCRDAGLERIGVMIETPSAALLAAEILDVVDFVSLGTNDLTQYTMAADRQLGELAELGDPWQPAVLRLIAVVGDAGRLAGKPVGVCGEAAGDPALAPVLVGLGVTSLSMTPRLLGAVAERLAGVSTDDCRRAADAARSAENAASARAAAQAALR